MPELLKTEDSDTATLSPEGDYGQESIQALSDLEHLRLRPGMYVGDVHSGQALHHLVNEAVDNSIDEVMAGHAKHIWVTVHNEGSISIEDDGRGIPVERHDKISEQKGRDVSTLEAVMTMLKTGGKFDKKSYKTSGGLHGVGVKAVNFLSQWCEVQVCRGGHLYQQEFERGEVMGPVKRVGATTKRGTKVSFKPDPTIFGSLKFQADVLTKRLRELAFLNPGVHILFKDERTSEADEFRYERGIVEFVEYLNRASEVIHGEVVYIRGESEGVVYEVALQYANEYTENVHSYVNNIHTPDGGTHVSGFRTALTRSLNNYGKKEDIFKDITPTGEDFREGMTAIISIKVPEPQFQSQTKNRLLNTDVEGIINTAFGEYLGKYSEENPKIAKTILRKGVLAAEAREAARKAKEALRTRKGVLGSSSLPGKLRDCLSKNMEECELYLVEGDSAGGSAEGGRLRQFQAILPLRGKIINAYKSREDKVLENAEIQAMIQAIGTGIGADQDISRLRYNKIIIMTDADVDGSHIRTLLLCFFYRQMYQLVATGHVYVAQPPLFRVIKGKSKPYYVQTDEEMRAQLMERGVSDAELDLLPGIIRGTKMEQLTRILADVEEAIIALERRGISLKSHAERQDKTTGKLPEVHAVLRGKDYWFTSLDAFNQFRQEQEEAGGREISISDTHGDGADGSAKHPGGQPPAGSATGNGQPAEPSQLHFTELHEVRTINRALAALARFFNEQKIDLPFNLDMLIPQERTGSDQPRYVLRRGEHDVRLEDLRGLPSAIREMGQKGLHVTRFKGLGEMNAEELRETTLDPANRTLVKIKMDDVADADNIFRVLMGDKVEPRRDFIEKHALDVRNLDV